MTAPRRAAPTRRAFGPGARVAPLAALGAVGALVLAGCGSGSAPATPAGPATGVPASATMQARQAAIHRQVTAALHHLTNAHQAYGGRPGFLPTPTAVHRVQTASARHRILATQGDAVEVHLAHGSARFAVVGPDVPRAVIGTDATRTQATFDVTVTAERGAVPLDAALFSAADAKGHAHALAVGLPGGGRAPATLHAGQRVRMQLSGVLPDGDGQLLYRPAGPKPVVGWDFVVETD